MKDTWQPGDTCIKNGGQYNIAAGLFIYSGLGLGHYHSKDGKVLWCWADEAMKMARQDGVRFDYVDTM